jgi:hypothetical protein
VSTPSFLAYSGSRDAAGLLRVGDGVEGDRRLARGLRAVDLDDAPARQTTDAEGDVERDGSGGDHLDGGPHVVTQTHHGALAVALLDLPHHRGEGLVLVLFLHGCHVVVTCLPSARWSSTFDPRTASS